MALLSRSCLSLPSSNNIWKHYTAQFHLIEFDDHMCIDWPEYSPNGRRFACWSATGSLVRVWDTRTGQLVSKLQRPRWMQWPFDWTFPWRQTSLWKHNRLWPLYLPSIRLDFRSSNTHGVYTKWHQVGVLCSRLWLENMGLLQHEKWPDRGSNPDPSGTAPDALPLSYQVLQGIAMWPDSPFCQGHIRSHG